MNNGEYLKLKENIEHGTYMFPFVIYQTRIPDYYKHINIHWHEEIEILTAKKGKCNYYIDCKKYEVNEGDIVIIRPSMLHSFSQIENEIFVGDTLVFNLSMINNNSIDVCAAKYFKPIIDNKVAVPIIIHKGVLGQEKLYNYIQNVVDLYEGKKGTYELRMKAFLLLFFSELYDNFIKESMYEQEDNDYMLKKIKCILKYIKENYRDEITIEDLSKASNMSQYYLMRSFKKYIGKTCTSYINDYRLNKASSMLITTEYSIMNISIECGFNNISYFNKLFKEKFNLTPKEYRRKYNEIKNNVKN